MIIDLSHILYHNMPVFPGDDETSLKHSKTYKTDQYNNFQLNSNMHCGTHIDGPMHLLPVDAHISDIPIDNCVGQGCVIDASGQSEVAYHASYEQLIPEESIVVIHTGHSQLFGSAAYFTQYPTISDPFAQLLVRKRVKMLALDTPSPDRYPFEIHQLLFEHQILIAENLKDVHLILEWKSFEIIALPMAVQADSALARVIARRLA